MKSIVIKICAVLIFLAGFLPALNAEDKRTIPLDMNLIIDSSESLANSKTGTVAWINEQVVDRILTDGDRITIWAAGDKARVIFSDTVSGSAGKQGIKDKLLALDTSAKTADFSGALREAGNRVSQTPADRLSYTMLIASSAKGLEPSLAGNTQNLFRWFRSERYERWQVLVIATHIGNRVREAARSYIASLK